MANLLTYATFSDVTGQKALISNLTKGVSQFRFLDLFLLLVRVNLLLSTRQRAIDVSIQQILARNFFNQPLLDQLAAYESALKNQDPSTKMMVFYKPQILLLMRLCALVCNDEGATLDTVNDRQKLGPYFLMMNDFLSPFDIQKLSKHGDINNPEILLGTFVPFYEISNLPNIKYSLVRWKILIDSAAPFIRSELNINLEELFETRIGLPLEVYQAFAILVYFYYQDLTVDQILQYDPKLNINPNQSFHDRPVLQPHFDRFIKSRSIEKAELGNELYRSELSYPPLAFLTFRNFPFFKFSGNINICTDPQFLFETITHGVYHLINNALPEEKRDTFHSLFGKPVFESYVNSILERIFPVSPGLVKRFHPSPVFDNGNEISDAILDYSPDIVLIEYKHSLLTIGSKFSGQQRSLIDEIKKKFKPHKIAESIQKLFSSDKNSRHQSSLIKVESVRRVFPMLIALDNSIDVPLMGQQLNELFQEALARFKLLNSVKVEPLIVAHVEDIELIEQPIINGKFMFIDILKEKVSQDNQQNVSFGDFLYSVFSHLIREENSYMDGKFHEFRDDILEVIEHLAEKE